MLDAGDEGLSDLLISMTWRRLAGEGAEPATIRARRGLPGHPAPGSAADRGTQTPLYSGESSQPRAPSSF